jgi:hypothetical protein
MSSTFQQLSVASAHTLSRNITDLSNTFTPGRQEDSEEFLNCLLNHLVKCSTPIDVLPTSSRPYTSIDNLFRFEMKSSVECSECKQTTYNMEPYFVWNVPIDGHTSLLNALNEFCLPEYLSGNNAYSCGYCCKYIQASKRVSVARLSPYLIFSLKRFQSGLHDTRKLTHFVGYPEILDITSFCTDDYQKIQNTNRENFRLKFRLYCVIVHLGNEVDKGHLFAYIRAPDDAWYKANDSIITPVKLDQVLSTHDAYLLFYADAATISSTIQSPLKTNSFSSLTNSLQQTDDSLEALYLSTSQPSMVIDLSKKKVYLIKHLFLLIFRKVFKWSQSKMMDLIEAAIHQSQKKKRNHQPFIKVKIEIYFLNYESKVNAYPSQLLISRLKH